MFLLETHRRKLQCFSLFINVFVAFSGGCWKGGGVVGKVGAKNLWIWVEGCFAVGITCDALGDACVVQWYRRIGLYRCLFGITCLV